MDVEYKNVTDMVEGLLKHFYDLLFTKTVRDVSLSAKIKDKYWDYIKSMETQKSINYGKKTYAVEEVYMLIIPFVEFLKAVNRDVMPNLDKIIYDNSCRISLSPQEKSIRKMLLDNYKENILRFGLLILDIYEVTVSEDLKENKNRTPLCISMKEIHKLEEDLSFIVDYRKS